MDHFIPEISVVSSIYTSERYGHLISMVESVNQQRGSGIEVVVVIERVNEVFEQLTADMRRIRIPITIVFSRSKLGISRARNIGVEYARGRFVSFVDDDALVMPGWSKTLVHTFNCHPEAIGVTGPTLPKWEHDLDGWFPQELFWAIGCSAWKGLEGERETDYAWGANMSFRREIFINCSFRDAFTSGAHRRGKTGPVGDDVEFSLAAKRRSGGKIIFNPGVEVLHWVPSFKTKGSFVRGYAFWQGYSDARFKSDNKAPMDRLRVEYQVFTRIIRRLLPEIVRDLVFRHRVGLKKSSIVLQATAFFGLGYFRFLWTKTIQKPR